MLANWCNTHVNRCLPCLPTSKQHHIHLSPDLLFPNLVLSYCHLSKLDQFGTVLLKNTTMKLIWTVALLLPSLARATYVCTLPEGQEIFSGLTISGIIHPVDETVTIRMVYEGQAWLGIGRSDNGKMIGGEAVIGLPDSSQGSTNPGKYQMDSEENSGVYLFSDSQQTLQDASIVQDDTTTTLMFTKKLFEDGEYSIPSDSSSTWIYGVGRDNFFPAEHAHKGSFDLQFPWCTESSGTGNSTVTSSSSGSTATSDSPSTGSSSGGGSAAPSTLGISQCPAHLFGLGLLALWL
jgi:hypothetical protein